jgi:hypothetical protein
MPAALAVAIGALEPAAAGAEVLGMVVLEAVLDPLELHAASPALSATTATAPENRRRVLISDMGRSLLGEVGWADDGGRGIRATGVRIRRAAAPRPRTFSAACVAAHSRQRGDPDWSDFPLHSKR